MSCFIMNPDSIRKIGYTLAAILDGCEYSNTASIATDAAFVADLPNVFHQYFSRIRGYNGEGISEDLHTINARAYAGRYKEEFLQPFAPSTDTTRKSLSRLAQYTNHTESPQEWHYHLISLLDCWLYQTAEDATRNDPKRIALQAFAASLSRQIVQHSEEYNRYRWGE